jgi:hypothetical protein
MSKIPTAYGPVNYGGACKDDYANIRTLTAFRPHGGGHGSRPRHVPIKLQSPALASFLASEEALGHEIVVTGSWRSCAEQSRLYASDSHRYAPPNVTAHTRGLAIDASMGAPDHATVRRVLLNHGWHQARPDDEPWHFSFGVTV